MPMNMLSMLGGNRGGAQVPMGGQSAPMGAPQGGPPMAYMGSMGVPGGGRDMNFSPDPQDQLRCAMGDAVACQRIQQAQSQFENSYQYQLQQMLNQQALSSRAGNPYGQPQWSRQMGTSNGSRHRGGPRL